MLRNLSEFSVDLSRLSFFSFPFPFCFFFLVNSECCIYGLRFMCKKKKKKDEKGRLGSKIGELAS